MSHHLSTTSAQNSGSGRPRRDVAHVRVRDAKATKDVGRGRAMVVAGIASLVVLMPGTVVAQTDLGCAAANALATLGGRQAVPCKGEGGPSPGPSAQGRVTGDRLAPDQRAALDRVVPQVQAYYEARDPGTGVPRDEPCDVLLRQEWKSGRMQSLLYVMDECRNQTEAVRSAFRQRSADSKKKQEEVAEQTRLAEVAREAAESTRRRDEQFKADLARAEAYEAQQKEQQQAQARRLAQDLRSGKRTPEDCREWLIAQGQNPAAMTAAITRVALEPPRGAGSFWGDVLQVKAPKLFLRGHGDRYLVVSIDSKTKVFGGAQIRQGGGVSGFGLQTGVQDLPMSDGSVERSAAIAATCVEPSISSK